MKAILFNKKLLLITLSITAVLVLSGITFVSASDNALFTDKEGNLLFEIRTFRAIDKIDPEFQIVYFSQNQIHSWFQGSYSEFCRQGGYQPLSGDSATSGETCFDTCDMTCSGPTCPGWFTCNNEYTCASSCDGTCGQNTCAHTCQGTTCDWHYTCDDTCNGGQTCDGSSQCQGGDGSDPFTSNNWNPICWVVSFINAPGCGDLYSGDGIVCAGTMGPPLQEPMPNTGCVGFGDECGFRP